MRSFHLLEESMCVIGETGCFRPYATATELRSRLEPKLAWTEVLGRPVNPFLLGESVNVWTVHRGRLVAGLDVTRFVTAGPPGEPFRLDWAGVAARLEPLPEPVAGPGDTALSVRPAGARPEPDLLSYIDALLAELSEPDRPEWAPTLDYGAPYTV